MEKNSEAKSVNAIEQSEDRFQDDYEENELDIAGVKIDQKYKSRTTALPQHNLGFQ